MSLYFRTEWSTATGPFHNKTCRKEEHRKKLSLGFQGI